MALDMTSPNSVRILVVDDEANIRKTLTLCLESEGYEVVAVSNTRDAEQENSRRSYDLVFLDLRLGVDDGMDLVPVLLSSSPWLKIVVITAYSSIETAVEAMRRGCADYIAKPFTPAQVKIVIENILKMQSLERRVAAMREELEGYRSETGFLSVDPAMQRAVFIARQVAPTDATVLLVGESGTGKTALARQIHCWSKRASKPIGVISCPSLSAELLESELFGHVKGAFTGAVRDNPGRIAACDGGTLLLDEIAELPLSIQPKLLRFLQDREYERVGDSKTKKADVRLIAATNADLDKAVARGKFREDLRYRLNVIQIEIPPLRERPEDIVPLSEMFLVLFGAKYRRKFLGFSPEAQTSLKKYPWSGNIRELKNAVERAAILCPTELVGPEFIPGKNKVSSVQIKLGDSVSLAQIEEEHIRKVLASSKSLANAAEILGIDQATLWRRRKHYGI